MDSDRIKEIQKSTGLEDSVSVQQALMQVWNECKQELKEALAEIERLKKTDEIETILAVTDMYYAAKCNHCGWIGSSKSCVEARAGGADDCEVLCPLCFRHISDDEPSLKDVVEFLNRDVIKIVERRDKLIEQMRQALGIGLESTRELLHEFDKKHGRTTPKNRLYTERWEAQIKQMETALEAAERG